LSNPEESARFKCLLRIQSSKLYLSAVRDEAIFTHAMEDANSK